MNDIKTVLIVLQFVVIAVLTYFVIGGKSDETSKIVKFTENARSSKKGFQQTSCKDGLDYSINYRNFMDGYLNPDQLNEEGATFKIDKGNLMAVINANSANYIVGVIARRGTSNTIMMVPVDTNGNRVDMKFPMGSLGSHLDEMYPIIKYLGDPHCYDFLNCPK